LLAKTYWQTKEYSHASKHYINGNIDSKEFADLLFEWSGQGYSHERDLFIARAVFQMLCAKKKEVKQVYSYYMNRHYTCNAQQPDKYP
ncbi:DUF410 domain-containing protein, partial [Klebsiella pneumoniae]|nr:DUF410 domain-containing protein [Klebsiella pneumoniae]